MPIKYDKTAPRILYSCYTHVSREGEQFIPEHVFGYILAGSQDMSVGDKTYHFNEGDFRFFSKNQLCKFVKNPPAGGEFISLSAILDKDTLQSISQEHNLHADGPYTGEATLLLEPNELFKNYVASLKPYINSKTEINRALTSLKVKEAVMLLLDTNPGLKNVLFDFAEPGKIDLEAYMAEHYKYNVDINRFAYLTGRSLATFKRDFERIFHTSPNRWLQQKRLTDAHYLIKEKGWRSSDVYMEVGFKDLSHFSFAFKKAYGVPPSRL
ncbi:AraC family transcriptional regulator [Mucilaginibacter sp.]|uniref:AraC family transcriptional regulator n=1 Tax=Mucilaginibacter sp. TaxID=1882438 RepID=UPI002619209B|nr:AraC family transcriptional regulator [Mucilaginibacter sp.]MDB5029411.1 AraC family transcriptional regulator [Mucilaginibacter sp.]